MIGWKYASWNYALGNLYHLAPRKNLPCMTLKCLFKMKVKIILLGATTSPGLSHGRYVLEVVWPAFGSLFPALATAFLGIR